MIPADIGPHPDAPNHYTRMGKPESWADEDCGSLGVRRVGATGDLLCEPAARIVSQDLPSGDSIYPAFLTEWTFTPEEKLLIAAGQPLRILTAGNGLQPMSAWVRHIKEV